MYHNNRQLLEDVLKGYENIMKVKLSLEIDEADGYPSGLFTTYTLQIKRDGNLIYKDQYCLNKLHDMDGEEILCLIAISDLIHYGLDKLKRDFDDR